MSEIFQPEVIVVSVPGSQGAVGPKGDKGDKGDVGNTGSAATIALGSVTTGAAGSNAVITNSGTTAAAIFNFTVPRGDQGIQGIQGPQGIQGIQGVKGDTGTAATIALGSVTTGAAGSNASITNTGTSGAAVFNFTIPRGNTGATGSQGIQGIQGPQGAAATIAIGTTTTSAAGGSASVTNSGTSGAAVFNFTIPTGPQGPKGDPGTGNADINAAQTWTQTQTFNSSIVTSDPLSYRALISANKVVTADVSHPNMSALQMPFDGLWHDILAFNKGGYTRTQEYFDGTSWFPATFNTDLFSMKENQTVLVANSTQPGMRWTFSSMSWATVKWMLMAHTYHSVASSKRILVESSVNGTTWVTRHDSTYSTQAQPILHAISDWGGDTYVRITVLWLSGGDVRLSSIRLLTARWGDQGLGREVEFPYTWNGLGQVGIGLGGSSPNKGVALQVSGGTFLEPPSTSTSALTVQSLAGQTADIQQWRNSAGGVLGVFSAGGSLTASGNVYASSFFSVSGGFVADTAAHFQSSAATQRTLVLKGFASQTADLQQWRDSAGNINSRIEAGGRGIFNAVSGGGVSPQGIAYVFANGSNPSVYQMAARAAVGQTADIHQWQDSAGNALLRFTSSGGITNSGVHLVGSHSWSEASAQLGVVVGVDPARPGILVKGMSSQTGDLQQWQDSAGAVLSRVSSSGIVRASGSMEIRSSASNFSSLHFLTTAATSVAQIITDTGTGRINIDAPGSLLIRDTMNGGTTRLAVGGTGNTVTLTARGNSGQTADLQQWQDNTGAVVAMVQANGVFGRPGGMYFGASSAGIIGLRVGGAASQTADLQQWQNSAGGIIASVRNDGAMQTGALRAYSGGPTNVPVVARAAVSQTANLQEWQDSASSPQAFMSVYGALTLGGSLATGGRLNVGNTSTATVNIVARMFAGQTVDMQQWQDSAGSRLAYVNNLGQIFEAGNRVWSSGNVPSVMLTTNTAQTITGVKTFTESTGATALIVQGAPGQTASLQEWKNSAGNLAGRISSSGSFVTNSGSFISGFSGQVAAISILADTPPMVARAAVGQTADLHQWQNNSGTILARVANDGDVYSGEVNLSNAMVTVNHGADANVARPVGAVAVYWVGTVEPVNSIDGDLWMS